MIKIVDGDILNAKTDFIMHQVNCQGVMNSGVAKALRNFDEGIFIHYKAKCEYYKKNKIPLLGENDYYWLNNDYKCVVSLFAQDKYGYDKKQYTDTEAFTTCLRHFKALYSSYVEESDENNNVILRKTSIALPYKIGCVRGGADWAEVYKIIEKEFIDYDVELWRLDAE